MGESGLHIFVSTYKSKEIEKRKDSRAHKGNLLGGTKFSHLL